MMACQNEVHPKSFLSNFWGALQKYSIRHIAFFGEIH